MIYHVLHMMVHNGGYSFSVPINGAAGVDLFFVISGFIMMYTCAGTFRNYGVSTNFLRRRFVRIVPVYWLYTSVIVLLLAVAPGLFSSTVFNWTSVISSYLFLLSEISQGNVGTLLQTGWTLCYEVYFYLIFAILLKIPQKYFLLICGGIFLIGYLSGLAVELPVWLSVVSNPILFEFLMGAVLASFFTRGFYLSLPPAILSISIGLFVILFTDLTFQNEWSRVFHWGIPAAMILLGALSLEQSGGKVPKFIVALGNSSYSLYLVHPFVLPLMGKLWVKYLLSRWFPSQALFLVALMGSIALGHFLYWVVEKNVTARVSSWLSMEQKSLNNSMQTTVDV